MHNDNHQPPLRVLQLTDPHLGDQPGEALMGLDTDYSLQCVIKQVQQNHREIDVLLATGDLSHSATIASYQRFHRLSEPLASKRFWLPGNHDDWRVMQQATQGGAELNRCINMANWRIVMINSTIPGEVGGRIDSEELKFVEQCVAGAGEQHVLLCLHHHPISSGCAWLDEQQVSNGQALLDLIGRHQQVKGVIWGHIHQALEQQYQQARLMATPSTCIQFAANSQHFGLDQLNPGYRWLELHADGRIDSTVHRVEGAGFNVDYSNSNGY